MKRILLILAAMSSLVSSSRGEDDSLLAQELAFHMGVSSWVSKVKSEGRDLTLQIFRVVDGKEGDPILGCALFPLLDREYCRIAILASQAPRGTRFSIQVMDGLATKYDADYIPLEVITRLPPTISEGDYILGWDIASEAIRDGERNIGSLKTGILLRVARAPSSR